MRVVIDVRKDANASVILNNLYKQTPLQTSLVWNMIALVNGRPKLINLKEALVHYLEHQKTVVRRRTQYNLRKAKDRAHILEGLRIALIISMKLFQRFVNQKQIKSQWKACNNASNFLKK